MLFANFASRVKKSSVPQNLEQFVQLLCQAGELVEITCPVDPHLEIAEIHRRVSTENGPALLFSNVKGSQFPIVSNLFGSKKRLSIALGADIEEKISTFLDVLTSSPSLSHLRTYLSLLKVGTVKRKRGPVLECRLPNADLNAIAFTTSWPTDGGAFLTQPLVYTEDPTSGKNNLGMYRVQRFSPHSAGLHWQIGKGGGFHYQKAEQLGSRLPVTIFLGGPPALTISAIAPLPEQISELLFASFILGKRLHVCPQKTHPLISECDIALKGYANPNERAPEGPFGDHFGYVDTKRPFPVFHCTDIYHKKRAIVPITVVGKPFQEDAHIGSCLNALLKPSLRLLIPSLLNIHTYAEAGFHSLAAIQVASRYKKEALTTALRILGEGQLSLTKTLIALDQNVALDDIKAVFTHLLERIVPEEDIIVLPSTSTDTLDIASTKPNQGAKIIFLGTGEKKRSLPYQLPNSFPSPIKSATLFSPGCLLISGPSYKQMPDPSPLLNSIPWPLIILVDDAKSCAESTTEFLWQTFTRFDPGQDLFSSDIKVCRNGVSFSMPLLIDARTKPFYPPVVVADEQTCTMVSKRWHEYFPKKT